MLGSRVSLVEAGAGRSPEALTAETAVRVQTGLVLIFLAARGVHVGQALIDLTVGNAAYARPWAAEAVGLACVLESTAFAVIALRARRLTARALLGDAAFGVVGLAVLATTTTTTLGRAASLNWMLPYTVGTAVGFGLVAAGDLRRRAWSASPDGPASERRPGAGAAGEPSRRRRLVMGLGGLAAALTLAAAYVLTAILPGRLPDQHLAQVLGNAANYPLFFVAALLMALMLRRGLGVVARREEQASREAAELAHEGQWRAVVADVFGPAIDLLRRVSVLDDGQVPPVLRQEADRLISMIEAVNPLARTASCEFAELPGD